MKTKFITSTLVIVAILAAFALGYRSGKKTNSSLVHFIEIEGIQVEGQITSITPQDVSEISKAIQQAKVDQPIISIRVIQENHVEVTTGTIRGPLDGGGFIYEFKKNENKWELINPNMIKSWVS